MTPKQKAQELYRNTYKKAMQIRGSDLMTEVAKEFALLTVDEIINTGCCDEEFKYWEEVERELEKL